MCVCVCANPLGWNPETDERERESLAVLGR